VLLLFLVSSHLQVEAESVAGKTGRLTKLVDLKVSKSADQQHVVGALLRVSPLLQCHVTTIFPFVLL